MSQLVQKNLTGYSYRGINGIIGGNIMSPILDIGGPTIKAILTLTQSNSDPSILVKEKL